jgi:hypothetical protein
MGKSCDLDRSTSRSRAVRARRPHRRARTSLGGGLRSWPRPVFARHRFARRESGIGASLAVSDDTASLDDACPSVPAGGGEELGARSSFAVSRAARIVGPPRLDQSREVPPGCGVRPRFHPRAPRLDAEAPRRRPLPCAFEIESPAPSRKPPRGESVSWRRTRRAALARAARRRRGADSTARAVTPPGARPVSR